MKRFTLFLFFLCLPAYTVYSIPKEIENALKLNRINHFDEALEIVENALREEQIKPDITTAYTIGRILYRKGELYREMGDINLLTHIGHLLQVKEREANPPDELKLFLGIGYFFNKQYLDAAGVLNQVVNNRTIDKELYPLSLVYLGASYYRSGERQKAFDLWKKVKIDSLFAYSTLGYFYAYLQINASQGEEITRNVLERMSESHSRYINSMRVNHAYTLFSLGKFGEAYDEVSHVNLDSPIYIYMPNQNKEIRFYDLAILESYSKILFGESIKNLEPIVTASSGELASFASYYVAQMYLYLGEFETGLKYAQKAKKLSVMSSLTMIRAVTCEASAYYLMGKERKGLRLLESEVERIYGKPSALLEMMKVIISSGVDFTEIKDIVTDIETYIYETEWVKERRDRALLGELSFYTGRYVMALYYLERARDKANKNKIETNDPAFLLKLSYIYYIREYYPESLEILFSLGKMFSGIRPLQDAVQSVYSYKQRGSGEAIID